MLNMSYFDVAYCPLYIITAFLKKDDRDGFRMKKYTDIEPYADYPRFEKGEEVFTYDGERVVVVGYLGDNEWDVRMEESGEFDRFNSHQLRRFYCNYMTVGNCGDRMHNLHRKCQHPMKPGSMKHVMGPCCAYCELIYDCDGVCRHAYETTVDLPFSKIKAMDSDREKVNAVCDLILEKFRKGSSFRFTELNGGKDYNGKKPSKKYVLEMWGEIYDAFQEVKKRFYKTMTDRYGISVSISRDKTTELFIEFASRNIDIKQWCMNDPQKNEQNGKKNNENQVTLF